MTVKDDAIETAIAAMTPEQQIMWRRQWLITRVDGSRWDFNVWLRYQIEKTMRAAERRLQEHNY